MLKPRKGDPIAAEGERGEGENANARFASSPLPPSSGMMRFKSEQSELSKRKLWKSIPFQTTVRDADTIATKFFVLRMIISYKLFLY